MVLYRIYWIFFGLYSTNTQDIILIIGSSKNVEEVLKLGVFFILR